MSYTEHMPSGLTFAESIEVNPELQQRAAEILEKRARKKQQEEERARYVQTCVEANFCPVCGGSILKQIDNLIFPSQREAQIEHVWCEETPEHFYHIKKRVA